MNTNRSVLIEKKKSIKEDGLYLHYIFAPYTFTKWKQIH